VVEPDIIEFPMARRLEEPPDGSPYSQRNDTAIETYLWPPVSPMENKCVTAPTPIRRSPEQADLQSQYPRPRNPVIIAVVVVIGPVARGPDITLTGAKRLFVDGQSRRTYSDPRCSSESRVLRTVPSICRASAFLTIGEKS
jgi:hypothetical protein